MKHLLFVLILWGGYLGNVFGQKPVIHLNAGYSSSDLNFPYTKPLYHFRPGRNTEVGYLPGYYLGVGLERKRIAMELNYVNNGIQNIGEFYKEWGATQYARLNFLQLSAFHVVPIVKNLTFSYGPSTNIAVYSYSRFKGLDGFDEPYELFSKGVSLLTNSEFYSDIGDYDIRPNPFTLNLASRLKYKIKKMGIVVNYNLALTKAIRQPTRNFNHSNFNLGLSYDLVKVKD